MDVLSLWLSVKLAILSTIALIIIGAPLAWILVNVRFAGKSLIEALINLPMALPPTVLGFYLLVVMGPKGGIGRCWERATGSPMVFTFTGILFASLIYSLPVAMQPMKTAFEKIDRRLVECACVLGLSPVQIFFRVVIPNSLRALAASAVLIFIHTMGGFGVILMVGGSVPGRTKTASIAIFEAVESLDYRSAAMMCLVLAPLSFFFLMLINRLSRSRSDET